MSIAEKLTTIAENVEKVYSHGVEQGKQAEYDKFWDNYQNNGTRRDYHYAFAGEGWTSELFFPKYDINPYQFIYTFARTRMNIDLAQRLQDCGIKLNLSTIANAPSQALYDTSFTRYPDLDFSRAINLNDTIGQCKNLKTIDSITFSEELKEANRLFNGCTALENIVVKGVMPISISFSSSPLLTIESMRSIINALKDYSKVGSTYTLTLHATAKAKLTENDIATITQKGWTLA